LTKGENDTEEWESFRGGSMPSSISKIVSASHEASCQTKRTTYELDAVVSFIQHSSNSSEPEPHDQAPRMGHHVVHLRVPTSYKKRLLGMRLDQLERLVDTSNSLESDPILKEKAIPLEVLMERLDKVRNSLASLEKPGLATREWILANGFAVSESTAEDARDFHAGFKEPCLVVFRAVTESDELGEDVSVRDESTSIPQSNEITVEVLRTKSISNGTPPKCLMKKMRSLVEVTTWHSMQNSFPCRKKSQL